MHALIGLPGCRQILYVIAAHVLILLVAMAVSLTLLAFSAASEPGIVRSLSLLVAFLLPIAVIATLYTTLAALSESIELLWSVNAKRRLKNWVLPALVIGVVFAAGAFLSGLLWGTGSETSFAFWTVSGLEVAAFLAPLAALSLFAAGGLKRYLAMRKGAKAMERSLAKAESGEKEAMARVRSSFATETGTATTSARPNPQGFTLAGITSRPFHDPASFEWMRAFEERFDEIRAEAEAVLSIHKESVDIYKYPGLDGDQWKAFKFVARHKPLEEKMKLCPVTASLLKTVPGYPIFRDAMFSILAPGGEISRHRDVANIFLTAHLGLITPPGGFVEVGGEARPWKEGEFVVFDSSYEHRALNPSNAPRVVLLIDFLHPEITEAEREWIKEIGL
jgi:beta-hydroxylase